MITPCSRINETLTLILTLILALVLQVSPWPQTLTLMRDAWVPLVLIFWVLARPEQVNIGTGFIIGLLWDAQLDGVIGIRAFSLSLLAYCIAGYASQLRSMSLAQQTIIITLLSITTHSLISCSESFVLGTSFTGHCLWLHFFDGLLWLVLSVTFRRFLQHKNR